MKAEILFIDGLLPRHESITFLGYLPPLATILEENGFSFNVLNLTLLNNYSLQGLYDIILSSRINIIGMSTNADNIKYVIGISNFIKERNPNIKIILGGPEASFDDIRITKNSNCDFVVRGEGEKPLIEIIKALKSKTTDFSHINNITYKNKANDVIRNKADKNHIEIPKNNYNIFKDEKYWLIPHGVSEEQFEHFIKTIRDYDSFFLTGRGCPYKCSFCVEGNMKRKINYVSLENIRTDLINYLEITGRNDLYIVDDTFTTTPKRVTDVCNIFSDIRKGFDFVWYCEGRVNVLAKHPELIDMMYNAGLRKLQIGIESGVQRILDVYNKNITLEQIRKVVDYCSKFEDLVMHGNIIIGNPFETEEEFKSTVEFVKELLLISKCKLDISSSYLTPYKGTPIRMYPEKFGFEPFNETLDLSSGFGMSSVTCKPKDRDVNEIHRQKHLFEIEINKTYKTDMFNLDKQEVDKRIQIYETKYKSVINNMSWDKSYKQLRTFDIVLKLKKSDTTVNLCDNLNDTNNLYPLRLWNLPFDKEKGGYELTTFKGDRKIMISNTKVLLWYMATGNYSLNQICQLVNKKKDMFSMSEIIDFYLFLENNYYVVFKKWTL